MTTIAGPLLPLSAAQQEIWIAHEVDGANPRYNCGGYVEVREALDSSLARGQQAGAAKFGSLADLLAEDSWCQPVPAEGIAAPNTYHLPGAAVQ